MSSVDLQKREQKSNTWINVIIVITILVVIGFFLYFLFGNKNNQTSNATNLNMKNLKMAVSRKIIEGFDTPTYIDSFNIFLQICKNILGQDMPVLCYNINNITDINPDIPNDPGYSKVNRMINELFPIAIQKSLDGNNIYDTGALYIAYTNMSKNDLITLEYDKDGIPSKFRISTPLPDLLNKLGQDKEIKNEIVNKFPELMNNKTDILTLEEVGKISYLFGKLISKKLDFTIDPSKYPRCDK